MDNPFTTIGDEPVEARIVAWVLGEASTFEAAELERLCEERPELMIFKHRMLALHGLLAEVGKPQADDVWKLSPEKRRAVEEILGEGQPIRLEVAKEKRIRRSGRRAFLAIAACVLFTLVITQLLPWKETSEAIIEVKPRQVGMSPLGGSMTESSGAGRLTPQLFGTEFEKIKSRNSLEKVVENLDLEKRWGMDKGQAVEKLKDSIKTENVRGTDLIKIQVRQSDKKDADEIAREVAYAYKDYREQIEKQDADRALAELNKAVRDQEDKVEERRKVLATIDRTKQAKTNDQLAANDSREAAIKRGLDAQDYVDAKREFESDQELLQQMKLKQMGETISRRIPGESVEIHEVPEVTEYSRSRTPLSKLTQLWKDSPFTSKSAESKEGTLASNASARTQRLETSLPKELIEGTPRPMNVPNLEVPADGPAGSATWSMARAAREAKPAPAEPAAPASSMAKAGAGTLDVTSGTSVPAPEVESAPSLALGDSSGFGTGSGSGGGYGGGGGAPAAGEPAPAFTAGNRNGAITAGNRIVEKKSIDGSLNETGGIEGEGTSLAGDKAQQAGKAPVAGDMPVLGALFSDDEKSNLSAESRLAQNDELSGANTFSGDTTVTGGAPGFGGSGGVAGNAPAPAAEPMQAAPVPLDANGPVGAVAGQPLPAGRVVTEEVRYKIDESDKQPASGLADADYWDTSNAVAKGKASGKEYELHTGYKSEYLFRGVDLGKDHVDGADKADNEQDLRLPRITTRSALAPDKAIESALELRKLGKTDVAKKILEDTLSENPANQEVRDEIAKLDDPIRTNPALTYEHAREVDGVRRGLDQAEGNYNLGKFDDAKREYEDVLRKDPHNLTARRGMEKIASAKSDYYRAAYDHTRAELLAEVDEAWEKAVPEEQAKLDVVREFQYPTEFEPPASPNADAQAAEFPKTPASPPSWTGQDEGTKKEAIDSLAKAIRDQEDKVEERRKVLSTIVRTKGIIYKGSDSFYDQGGVDEDQGARNALETYHQLEQEKLQLESQISSLLKYDSDQLMVYASGLNLPDNIIRNLYPQYLEAKRQLDADKSKGLGDTHPSVKTKVGQIDQMKRQLDEGVINLRATLQAQLDLASNRLKSVEAMKDQTREMAIKRGLDAQDYQEAKKAFENDQQLLQQMKLKLMAASMKAKPEPPKPDLAKLMEEIAAAEEPYSTFSLNISDASFRIAQAALAKGERPDPAGIKVEQFYNAVDYGDPAPAAGEPVSCAIEQAAHPVIPGRNLVRVALKTAAAGRSASQPLRLTLLVDQSGSMTRADRRAAMDAAMTGLGKLLTDKDLVNIVGFSRSSRLVADGMKGDEAGRKLAELVNQSASEGGTNLETAIDLAGQMAQRRMLAGAQNRIVLFTDGAANLGDADPQHLAAKVERLRQQGVAFDIAGIAADGLNDELLGELARKGNGRYYVVGKGAEEDFAKQLAGAFRPAAENVKVQVRFNPERVLRYKLIGFEKDRLKTEDFRNDKVDAAELAAEEAGVAIYQIEPNPNGTGEIGEVGVRFRDTASGEMVERGWTMPHDAAVPAVDRATPSMQLAVISMFAAEKLKGGTLADAIDFKQLAEAQANVRQSYGGNARVAEVLRMVDALK